MSSPDRPLVRIVGLGPAGADLATAAAVTAIAEVPVRFVRTWRHPAATLLEEPAPGGPPTQGFDELYEAADTMGEVYAGIVERLVDAAVEHGEILYAVPGSPVVAERTVELLVADPRVEARIVPALSFLDLAWARLGVDPLALGVRVVDGHRFEAEAAGERGPLLVAQCDAPHVLGEIKLALGDALDRAPEGPEPSERRGTGVEPTVTVIQRLGLPDEAITTVAWHELDRIEPDHLTSLWLPDLAAPVAGEVQRFVELVARLRAECPWDREQTHQSLRRHLLEEAYEVLEAIDHLPGPEANGPTGDGTTGDGAGGPDHRRTERGAVDGHDLDEAYLDLEEELGDLLFQIVFHASLATEAGRFTLADVAATVTAKLRQRHPHVFGDAQAGTPEEQAAAWEQAKKAEKGRGSVFDGIPDALPGLLFALKVQKKAATLPERAGLPEVASLRSAAAAVAAGVEDLGTDAEDRDGEGLDDVALGGLLMAVVDVARRAGIDPENALRATAVAWRDQARAAEA